MCLTNGLYTLPAGRRLNDAFGAIPLKKSGLK
jgi:hypothetical protein